MRKLKKIIKEIIKKKILGIHIEKITEDIITITEEINIIKIRVINLKERTLMLKDNINKNPN
jgi:hypothetical protein